MKILTLTVKIFSTDFLGSRVSAEDILHFIHGRSGEETLNLIFNKITRQERLNIKQFVDTLEETSTCQLLSGAHAFIEEISLLKIPIVLVTSAHPEIPYFKHLFI